MSLLLPLVRVFSDLRGDAGGEDRRESVLEVLGGVCSSVLRVLEPSLSSGEPPELGLPRLNLFCCGDFLSGTVMMTSPMVWE